MRCGGAGGEIAVAPAFLTAERADALHVTKHERFGTRQIVLIDAERGQHLRQFVGGMRPAAHQAPPDRRKTSAIRQRSDRNWRRLSGAFPSVTLTSGDLPGTAMDGAATPTSFCRRRRTA